MDLTVAEIESAIKKLPPNKVSELSEWLVEFEAEISDEQIAEDLQNGKLRRLINEAEKDLADKNFELLEANPKHPSLHFKQIGNLWSVRVGKHFRALGLDKKEAVVWFWIGSYTNYDRLIR